MQKFKVFLITSLVACLVGFSLGLVAGYRLFHPGAGPTTQVNAQLILTALHDRGFLVTQTYIFDQPVTITKSTGSAFKDFFFGQTITARGVMEVNLGTDLAKLTAQDITVEGDIVTVHIPKSALFNTRLVGPIELKNEQGVLKKLFDSDDGYNSALAELTKVAEGVAQKPELLERSDAHAKEAVAELLGYVAKNKTIHVEVR